MFLSLILSFLSYLLGLASEPVFLIVCGLLFAPFFGACMSYFHEIFNKQAAAVISMAMAFGSFTIVPMHALVGWITDRAGIQWALTIGPACIGFAFLLLTLEKTIVVKKDLY